MTEYRGQRSDGYVIVDNGGLFLSEEYGGATRSVRKSHRSTTGSWKVESGRCWSVLNEQDEGTEVCQANVTEAIRRRIAYQAYLWLKDKNSLYSKVEWDEDNGTTRVSRGWTTSHMTEARGTIVAPQPSFGVSRRGHARHSSGSSAVIRSVQKGAGTANRETRAGASVDGITASAGEQDLSRRYATD